ncbi:MAG TPA: hypothetical protein VGC24_06175, partial [Burkholderiaceae bacterium]
SLNDPQFSFGAVILRVIGNLVMKAITSPFALIASAFGGGDEMSTVAYPLGTAELDASARQGLDKVAKALTERPSLNMTVVGQASPDAERDAWKRASLNQLVQAEKRRAAVRAGQQAGSVPAVTAEEYPALLKEVYRRADIAKPRNLIGMAKDLPQAEMESLLLASIPMPDTAMNQLAVARGTAVRDYLATQGVPLNRLFLGAVKVVPPDPQWKPHAELSLDAR